MAMTEPYKIVGFDGLPVKGGIGRKPALVYDPLRDAYAAVARHRPLRWVGEDALREAVERKLVTRLPKPLGPWHPDDCVAYIDLQHLKTPWGGLLLEQIKRRSTLVPPRAWVWCEPLPDALERFRHWARLFLDSAAATLVEAWDLRSAQEGFAAVLAGVSGARFCAAAVGDGARDLRREAAELLAAAYLRSNRFEDEALWRDLSLDFDQNELDHIKAAALALPARPASPSRFQTSRTASFVREERVFTCI